MKTVNSLSGGKTSSYIAANYPADIDVFALVCVNDHNARHMNPDWARSIRDQCKIAYVPFSLNKDQTIIG